MLSRLIPVFKSALCCYPSRKNSDAPKNTPPQSSEDVKIYMDLKKMPLDCLEMITKNMPNRIDLFNLSLIDSDFEFLMVHSRIRPDAVTLRCNSKGANIYMEFAGDDQICVWKIRKIQNFQNGAANSKPEHKTIGGVRFAFVTVPHISTVYCYTEDPSKALKTLMTFLLHIFPKADYRKVTMNTDAIETDASTFLAQIPVMKTGKLTLKGQNTRTFSQISQILAEFECEGELHVEHEIHGSSREIETIKVKNLSLYSARFLTADHLINSKSSIIVTKLTAFTTSEILKFVRWWQESETFHLKYVILAHEMVTYQKQTIISKMGAEIWKTAERQAVYPLEEGMLKMKSLDCSDGYDIWREGEDYQLLATMVFDPQFFGFFVWPGSEKK